MRALIYTRVSSSEQVKGYSLEGQEKDCRAFALNNGYEVDRVFVEKGESAKTQNRTELQKLIKYAIEHKKNLTCLIIWKLDRFARNLEDQIELIKSFSKINIRVLSVTDNNEDNSVGRLMRNVAGSFAQYANELRAERTLNGMRQAIKHGRWCWRAPIGYKQARDATGKPLLVPTDESVFIIEAFSIFEKGIRSQVELLQILKKNGFKRINKTLLNKVLRNPLYAGLIKVKWFPDYIQAIHEALISKETFFTVQQILDGKRPSIVPKVRNHPDFPLRNFVRCPRCGLKLTAGWSTGRKQKRYPYYHCRTGKCSINLKKLDLENRFYEHLKSFEPTEDTLKMFEAIILDYWKTRQAESIKNEFRLEQELKELKAMKGRIDELMIKGVFDEATYKEKVEEINAGILTKTVQWNDAKIELADAEACVNYCLQFIRNIASLWANGDLNLKQRFQALIFPNTLTYNEDGTFGTTETTLIFKQLQGQKSRSI